MKIRWHSMIKLPHSWSFVVQSLARAMNNIGGNEIYIKSTDGLDNLPEDLKPLLIPGYQGFFAKVNCTDYLTEDRQLVKVYKDKPLPDIQDKNYPYDMDLAYTVFYQAPRRFHHTSKMKALIWNFESSILPPGWNLYNRAIDYILPSSQFSYDIFAANGIPKDKMLVVPHGVDTNLFNPNILPFQLKTQKKVKFLHNAIPHARKCHDRVLAAYLNTFTGDDDVCLIMKTKFKEPDSDKPFEVNVGKILEEALKGRSNPAHIEIVDTFIDDVGSLYTACDAVISMSSTEGFCLAPGTIVDTENGLKPIEEIKEGDIVTSHTGNQNVVTGTTKREFNDNLISIRRLGCSEWFSGTPEHPHLTIKRNNRSFKKIRQDISGGELPIWENLSKLEKGDLVCIPKPDFSNYCEMEEIDVEKHVPFVEKENEFVFLPFSFAGPMDSTRASLKDISIKLNCSFQYVSEVLIGKAKGNSELSKKILDMAKELNYSRPEHVYVPAKIKITDKLMEFFGLFLAEGSFNTKFSGFEITSHCSETYAYNLLDFICRDVFNVSYRYTIKDNKSSFRVGSKIISCMLYSLFGSGALHKKIPKELYNSKFITSLLRGFFYGDGSALNNRYSFSTSSRFLCQSIFEILLNFGILTRIRADKRKENVNYTLEVLSGFNDKFNKLIGPIKYNDAVCFKSGVRNNAVVETESCFYVPIAEIKSERYSGTVYNLHVEKDESYTSYGMATHNCLPLLESLACNSLVIAPRHGGQLDFLNDENSLLVDSGEMFAPQSMQYWNYDPKAVVGDPDVKHFSELLRKVYENPEREKQRIREAARKTVEKFSWEAAAQMILDLPIPKPRKAPMKRKVLYIVPYRMVGGGEVWVREAIKNLDRNIYEPHVALVSGTNEAIDNLFKDLNVTIEDLEHQGRDKGLKCLIESENYSLIHFYNSFGVYNVLKACYDQGVRVRVVETVHSDLVFNDSMMRVSKREGFVSAIAAVSNSMARKLLKGGNKNVVSLPQMVDWGRFEGKARSKDILKEFGVPDGFVVGFVGRLSPEKNIPVLLSCAKSLPDVSFVIVGSGPQESPLKQMAKELKNVFFIGARTDVEKFYPAFDALMLPSVMEGLPLVIIESMLTGTPVIASDVGAINELVIDSLNGYVIWSPNEVWMYVQAINNLRNKDIWNQFSTNSFALGMAAKAKAKQLSINTLYNKLF